MNTKSNSKKLHQFYTKPEVAQTCIENLTNVLGGRFAIYDYIVEPSAGSGSFFDKLDSRRIGLDVDPKHPDVITQDFLTWTPPQEADILVVGNPPFGAQSALAITFFRKASSFASTIAFIVPVTWNNYSRQRQLPEDYSLIFSEKLPKDSFTLDGQDYNIPCIFQIWTSDHMLQSRPDLRVREKPITHHSDFEFLPKTKTQQADFLLVVCGARKQLIQEVTANLSPFTVERIRAKTPEVREVFESIDWSKYLTENNSGTMWINRETIVREYCRYKQ